MTAHPVKQKAQAETLALFASDVHLQASLPRTTDAFLRFLRQYGMHTRRLYLLGDLFEYWAGDDDLQEPYHRQVLDAIRAVSDAGIEIFWIAGNRDFLVGDAFAEAASMALLSDPSVIELAGRSIVLTHGDALCTDDVGYMAFRATVRQAAWQQAFLAQPLAARKALIEKMRAGSREAQRGKAYEIMDVNADAVASLFDSSQSSIMIHGHTHRPGYHTDRHEDAERIRYVLPDWDCDNAGAAPRGGWLAADAGGRFSQHGIADLME